MKTFNSLLCVLASSLLLMCTNPAETVAQTLSGKWQVQGKEQAFHFSPDGAFAQQFDDRDAAFGVWYREDDMLAIVSIEDQTLVGFHILETREKVIALENMDDQSRITLHYLGAHEIPTDYVAMVVDRFGADIGELDAAADNAIEVAPTQEPHTQEPSVVVDRGAATAPRRQIAPVASSIHDLAPFFVLDPGNLSLVGCWTHDGGISDPMVFDEHGFYKKGSFEGDYIYEDLGLYHFDGKTLTVRFFKSAMNYSAGDVVSFEIRNLDSSGLTVEFGDGYAPRYSKNGKYRITRANRNEIRSEINHEAIEKTWWESGREQYLFLAPDLVITRKSGRSDFHIFAFDGNELLFRDIGANTNRASFGEVTAWSDSAIVFETGTGQKTLRSGQGNTSLSTAESSYYRNYVITHHNLTMQALLGPAQGMDIIDVEWKD